MLTGSAARTPFVVSGRRVDSTPFPARCCCFPEAFQDTTGDVAEPIKVILKAHYSQFAEICWHHDGGSDEAVRKVQKIDRRVGHLPKEVRDDRMAQLDEIGNAYHTEAIFREEGVALNVSKNDPR